jgi:SAM-dependent methyltransferase
MKECSKSISRRLRDPNFTCRYFRGAGIDIGGKPDPLRAYRSLLPFVEEIRTWDLEDGDAQFMTGVPDQAYDFVHSSHCLEHLHDPIAGLQNWFRILRQGGVLIVTVPDEDLYEQGIFPSTFNRDHKWSFTIYKPSSWSARSINVLDLLQRLGVEAAVHKVELIDQAYRYDLPRFDQTLTPVSESSIEFIVRRRLAEEVRFRGAPVRTSQPDRAIRTSLNQYRDDMAALKEWNKNRPPFTNDSEL